MCDSEEQEDELMALASIYEDSFTLVENDAQEGDSSLRGGELEITLDLPESFTCCIKRANGNGVMETLSHRVEYLPAIYLHFTFPKDYPSNCAPNFTVSCKWLNRKSLSALCSKLDELWEEMSGCVVMFSWSQFLKEESLTLLNITDILDLDMVRLSRHRSRDSNSINNTVTPTEGAQADLTEIKDMKVVENDNCVDAIKPERQHSSDYDDRAIQDLSPSVNLLRYLLDFNDEMRKKMFKLKTFECKVCFLERAGSQCIEFWPCNHVYCKECMTGYFEVQINSGNFKFLRCPEDKCESEANPKQVEELVPEDLYKRWDEMLLSSTLSSLGDIQPCPRRHCQYPVTIEDIQGSCPSCKFVFCSLCRFCWHGIMPCKLKDSEAAKVLETYINGGPEKKKQMEDIYGRKYLMKLKDEFLSMKFLEANSQKCPKCSTQIEKMDGCNKMTCQQCKCYFCWLCNGKLDKANPYSHFNSPRSNCFNKLFEGAEEEDEYEYFDSDDDDWELGVW